LGAGLPGVIRYDVRSCDDLRLVGIVFRLNHVARLDHDPNAAVTGSGV
jgi:hypothetical protein